MGAGAATFVGPAIVAICLTFIGADGVVVVFSALYLLAAAAVAWLTLPEEGRSAVEKGEPLKNAAVR